MDRMSGTLRAMKEILQILILAVVLPGHLSGANAQGASAWPSGGPARSVAEGGRFVATVGRFSIALPERVSRYVSNPEKDVDGKTVPGEACVWNMKEGDIALMYIERSDFDDRAEIAAYYFGVLRDQLSSTASQSGGRLTGERALVIDGARGIEFMIENSGSLTIRRAFVASGRMYGLNAVIPPAHRSALPAVIKVLDSFRLL
jgi:hypothetical protein